MSKSLLTVFGATGKQGGAVIDFVLSDPDLSKKFSLRGITRDASKPAAQGLKSKGVEVVSGDASDASSLGPALKGSHTVFIMTLPDFATGDKNVEISQGKAIADAAVSAGASYLIFSTLVDVTQVSGGKLTHVGHFDAKAEIEAHIRRLPLKSSFFAPGGFMQNYHAMTAPQPKGDGTYMIPNIQSPDAEIPLIDISESGKWVGAILADPAKYEGKVIAASEGLYTNKRIAEIISKKTGKEVAYQQIPEEVYRGFLPPALADDFVGMWLFMQDYGYYGKETRKEVEYWKGQTRGQVSGFEKYLEREPITLQ